MLGEILEPVIDAIAKKQRPHGQQEHEFHRAGTGAGMIATGLWWATSLSSTPGAQSEANQALQSAGLPDSIPKLACMLLLVIGGLLFFTGAARSRGSRDAMVAAKAIVWIAGAVALLGMQSSAADSPFPNFVLMTICVWTIASGATRLVLALRGMPTPQLPDPEEIGLPVSGPASREEAAESMSGKNNWKPPRFRD